MKKQNKQQNKTKNRPIWLFGVDQNLAFLDLAQGFPALALLTF